MTACDNILLIGLPGSGKSLTGQALAGMLRRSFVDVDQIIIDRHGSIESLFALGESCFRAVESAVLQELSLRHGTVIACGGGVVETAANRLLLPQMGTVFFLDKPASAILPDIDTRGRPLLQADPNVIFALEKRRRPWYIACAHHHIISSGDALQDAKAIRACL